MPRTGQDPDSDYEALLSMCRNAPVDGSLAHRMASLFLALDAQIMRGNLPERYVAQFAQIHMREG